MLKFGIAVNNLEPDSSPATIDRMEMEFEKELSDRVLDGVMLTEQTRHKKNRTRSPASASTNSCNSPKT